jgi:GT2 family glycosyltransferase
MRLSIIIINWNDRKVLPGCLRSIHNETKGIEYEVIISDNGSKDDTLEYVRNEYPEVVIVENKENLGFARGNNSGIAVAQGEYVLILNPDTLIHDDALDMWISWADRHPEAGAFGCRVLNPDGSFQNCARPFPTIWRYWIAALFLRPLASISSVFYSDTYAGWNGMSEREIDWQSGCCVMFRSSVLNQMQGFDPRFFYQFEEVDLCFRIHKAGYKILYTPQATITHLGGQSVGRFPIHFAIESFRNRYKYFHKHYGLAGARKCKVVTLAHLWFRRLGYSIWSCFDKSEALIGRMRMYQAAIRWNSKLDVIEFIALGEEPKL